MTAITFDNLWDNVKDVMESLDSATLDRLKRRADPDGLWDGKPTNIIESLHVTHYYYFNGSVYNQRMRLPLTYGHIELTFVYNKGDNGVNTLIGGHLRYYIPRNGDRDKVVSGDKVNRSFPANMFNSPEAFSKGFKKTFEKIVEAILKIFDNVPDITKDGFRPLSCYRGGDSMYAPYIVGAHRVAASLGRLRMTTKMMQDRCEVMGLDASLAKRLNEMANEMANLYATVGATHPHIALLCDRTDYTY